MADFGLAFPPSWRGAPAAMLAKDIPVWHRWLDRYALGFQRFYYNVRVGPSAPARADFDGRYRTMIDDLSRWRIDAVGIKPDQLWLFEISAEPSFRAVGQMLAYSELLAQEVDDKRPLIPALVAEEIDGNLAATLTRLGVSTFLV